MGIFGYLKKTEAEESKNKCVCGSFGLSPNEGNESIIDRWELEGSLKVGDQLQFCNPDQGMEALGTVEVKKLSSQNKDADSLTDQVLAHLVVDRNLSLDKLKKGSVLFSSGVDEEQKLSSYSDALYRAFVAIQEGQLTK